VSLANPIASFAIAAALAVLVTPWVRRMAIRVGALDRPTHRKGTGQRVVPRLGGLVVFSSCWAALSAFIAVGYFAPQFFVLSSVAVRPVIVAFGAGLAMLVLGAFDDKYDLPAKLKLAIQILVAIAVVSAGVRFDRILIGNLIDWELGHFAMPLSVIFLVGITNAVNLIDGVDGLATGSCLIIAIAVALIAGAANNVGITLLAAALGGACLGFLPYNFSPARIFLGDSGSLFVGMTLGVLGITSGSKTAIAGSMLIPMLLLGYPVLDTLLVMLRRKLSGRSIFSGDHGHIHHRLLGRGLTHGQTALCLYAFCLLFCFVAVMLAIESSSRMLWFIPLLCMALVGGALILKYPSHLSIKQLRAQRPHYEIARYRSKLAAAQMQLSSTAKQLFEIMHQTVGFFGVSQMTVIFPAAAENGLRTQRRRRLVMYTNAEHQTSAVDGEGDGEGDGITPEDGPAGVSADKSEPPSAIDTFRFPESRVTVRAQVTRNGHSDEIYLEYRIQLNHLMRSFTKRLSELPPQAFDLESLAASGIQAPTSNEQEKLAEESSNEHSVEWVES